MQNTMRLISLASIVIIAALQAPVRADESTANAKTRRREGGRAPRRQPRDGERIINWATATEADIAQFLNDHTKAGCADGPCPVITAEHVQAVGLTAGELFDGQVIDELLTLQITNPALGYVLAAIETLDNAISKNPVDFWEWRLANIRLCDFGLIPLFPAARVMVVFFYFYEDDNNALGQWDDGIDISLSTSTIGHAVGTVLMPHGLFWYSLPENWNMAGTNFDVLVKVILMLGMLLDVMWLWKFFTAFHGGTGQSLLTLAFNLFIKEAFFGCFALLSYTVGWYLVPCINFVAVGMAIAAIVIVFENTKPRAALIGSASFKESLRMCGIGMGIFGLAVQLAFKLFGWDFLLYPMIYNLNCCIMVTAMIPTILICLVYELYTDARTFLGVVINNDDCDRHLQYIDDDGIPVDRRHWDEKQHQDYQDEHGQRIADELKRSFKKVKSACVALMVTFVVGFCLGEYSVIRSLPIDERDEYAHVAVLFGTRIEVFPASLMLNAEQFGSLLLCFTAVMWGATR